MNDVKWNPDDSTVVFASVSRFHKHVWIREANTATGAVRTLFEESEPTHVESMDRLGRALAQQGDPLVFAARQLGPALSL